MLSFCKKVQYEPMKFPIMYTVCIDVIGLIKRVQLTFLTVGT